MSGTMDELLRRGVADIIDTEHLENRLKKGEHLRIKFGIDPTSPELHLGHLVPLRKLRQFQDAGHTAVLIIGDFTAKIGDPSGQTKLRVPLTDTQIARNQNDYEKQARLILAPEPKLEIKRNSKWFGNMKLGYFLEKIAFFFNKQRLQDRDDFVEREKRDLPISMTELIYPILQAYDSVAVKADLEIGGTDQLFNLLQGRYLVRAAFNDDLEPQDIMTLPILIGTDGKQKMSKSIGNTINLTDPADEVYGKVMSIPDDLVAPYFELVTDLEFKALAKVRSEVKSNPREAKARLAHLIVEMLYDEPTARQAEDTFNRIFRDKEVPQVIPEFTFAAKTVGIIDLIIKTKLAESRSEAIRLIEQGGVRVNGERIFNAKANVDVADAVIQVGKRRFAHATTKSKGRRAG